VIAVVARAAIHVHHARRESEPGHLRRNTTTVRSELAVSIHKFKRRTGLDGGGLTCVKYSWWCSCKARTQRASQPGMAWGSRELEPRAPAYRPP
jgi:hypothetical protein